MSTLTIDLPARRNQTEFNLRRWDELVADTTLGRDLARIEGRIETDRHGHIIMSPPPGLPHSRYQSAIAHQLRTLLPSGEILTECPISTADGVKAADGVWISRERLQASEAKSCLPEAPEICIEVLSPGNSRAEMNEKKALYFAAGAEEVWFCDKSGKLTFHCGADSIGTAASARCPKFPQKIEL